MEIVFWNCRGLRPKWEELEHYLRENNIDVIALNETFLKPHMNFSLPGYHIKRSDRTWSTKGGVAFLYKSELILNKVYEKLIHLKNDEHTHLDTRHGTTDILDMAFVTSSLKSRDIRFSVGESLGGDHLLPIEIFLDRQLQRSIPITSSRYQFAEADVNTFQNKMAEIFNSNLFYSFTPKASDLDEYQKHFVDSMKEAADTSIP